MTKKCGECQDTEYDASFRELWCMKKHKEVEPDDTCDLEEDIHDQT